MCPPLPVVSLQKLSLIAQLLIKYCPLRLPRGILLCSLSLSLSLSLFIPVLSISLFPPSGKFYFVTFNCLFRNIMAGITPLNGGLSPTRNPLPEGLRDNISAMIPAIPSVRVKVRSRHASFSVSLINWEG